MKHLVWDEYNNGDLYKCRIHSKLPNSIIYFRLFTYVIRRVYNGKFQLVVYLGEDRFGATTIYHSDLFDFVHEVQEYAEQYHKELIKWISTI